MAKSDNKRKFRQAKYELVEQTRFKGRLVYRIRALRIIGGEVPAGSLGGFVESYTNLSQSGECWVHNNAAVIEGARVTGNAMLFDNSLAKGRARLSGKATLHERAIVMDDARVGGKASINDDVRVGEYARVKGDVYLGGRVRVNDHTRIKSGYIHS
jgi:acyl-[acyl carrier protein]--UDP-N-acetylglucosamine O-acyltransferase